MRQPLLIGTALVSTRFSSLYFPASSPIQGKAVFSLMTEALQNFQGKEKKKKVIGIYFQVKSKESFE